ncbi:hypothetical protein F4553_001649 [Allocatelliglobosispora scoriae]|uniref:Uncharacterized protein n=1 Tax=Allocatelliglobosispora scoriae TaxID=643052 RepID=A0A841BN78_9ACTN|nr:hypothetical protein [Allocatelliglobosispora scoriae]MBB5868270.1 hypothetical protein [Allocatelliglobosispora scoriae]
MRILRGLVVGALVLAATPLASVSAAYAAAPGSSPLQTADMLDAKGTYYSLFPRRVLDTRTGTGAPKAVVKPGATVRLQVGGAGGVPTTGVAAVAVNLTVVGPTSAGYLTVFPTGAARPNASSINFAKGETRANSVIVALGTDGKIDIFNAVGSTHILIDVAGYYADATPLPDGAAVGGQLHPVTPQRLIDTRTSWHSMLPAGAAARVLIDYGPEITPHIRGVVVNVTAVTPTADGYLQAWSGDWGEQPTHSTLNFRKGSVVPNQAIVGTVPCLVLICGEPVRQQIMVWTSADTHVLVDIVAIIDDGTLPDGLRFEPRTPTRIVDTRTGTGLTKALGPNTAATVSVPNASIPAQTRAIAVNAAAVAPTADTFVTLWPWSPDETGRPDVSSLNAARGTTVANAAITPIGPGTGSPSNAFNVYNATGNTHVLVDLVGTFYPGTAAPAATGAAYTLIPHPAVLQQR